MSAEEIKQYDKVLEKAVSDNAEVVIHRNRECGNVLYAVSLVSDEGYWLDSFHTLQDAVEFCAENQLVITNYIKDRDTEEGG